MEKTRLSYARILINIPVDGPFLEFIDFINDHDVIVRLIVEYEWKPLKWNHRKMFGHIEEECRRKVKTRRNGEKSRIILLYQEMREAPNHREQKSNMTPKL